MDILNAGELPSLLVLILLHFVSAVSSVPFAPPAPAYQRIRLTASATPIGQDGSVDDAGVLGKAFQLPYHSSNVDFVEFHRLGIFPVVPLSLGATEDH